MIPMNIEMAMTPIQAMVARAFLIFGSRNAGTPLAIASTPVRAAEPDANARKSKKSTRVELLTFSMATTS